MDQNYSIVLSRPCQVYKTCMVLICVKGSTHSTNCIDCFRQPRFPTIRSNRHQSNGHWTPDRSCRNSQFFSFGLMYDFQTHCAQNYGAQETATKSKVQTALQSICSRLRRFDGIFVFLQDRLDATAASGNVRAVQGIKKCEHET